MYSMKVIKDHQRREQEWDFRKILTGEFMALFANANSKQKFRREDFFKLSSDTVLTEDVDPDLFNKVARRLGSKIKGKDGIN